MSHRRLLVLLYGVLGLVACAHPGPRPTTSTAAGPAAFDAPTASSSHRTPVEVVLAATEAAANRLEVQTRFVVQGTSREGALVFLNVEPDYRDPRCLTIVLTPNAIAGLKREYGEDLLTSLRGKRITAPGEAKRVKIYFSIDGQRTDKYDYQTQLRVADRAQLKISDAPG